MSASICMEHPKAKKHVIRQNCSSNQLSWTLSTILGFYCELQKLKVKYNSTINKFYHILMICTFLSLINMNSSSTDDMSLFKSKLKVFYFGSMQNYFQEVSVESSMIFGIHFQKSILKMTSVYVNLKTRTISLVFNEIDKICEVMKTSSLLKVECIFSKKMMVL